MERVGEYLVRRLVGEGGMGKVYEAEERLSKRRVALKVLREELSQSEHARGLFLNEMQILARLEHPNIVRSLASIETDGKLVTVLEYLEGSTLRQTLGVRRRLPWPEVSRIAVAVARALTAAHEQTPPVIHRDLKPENIMLLNDQTVKVMDFGIAKLLEQLEQTHTQTVGTLQYMSPEQIDAKPVSHHTDLYGLGLVFYEALTGKPPFQSASPRALLNMQCNDPPPPLDEELREVIPRGIEKLLFRLLEKEPAARPSSAREVAERLEQLLPEAPPPEPRRSRRLEPVAAAPASPASESVENADSAAAPLPAEEAADAALAETAERREDTLPSADGALSTRADPYFEEPASAGRADRRELSTGLSFVIIVALMAVAALVTFLLRSG